MTASHLENIKSDTDEIVEITDELTHLAADISLDASDIISQLEIYRSHLEKFGSLGLKTGSSGLWDLSAIIMDGLDIIIAESRALTAVEYQFLNKLPQLLSDLVLFPESKIAGRVLLNYLKRPEWVKPLEEADETLLTGIIFPDVEARKINDNSNQDVSNSISLDDIDAVSSLQTIDDVEINDFESLDSISIDELSSAVDAGNGQVDHLSDTSDEEPVIELLDFENDFELPSGVGDLTVDEQAVEIDIDNSKDIDEEYSLESDEEVDAISQSHHELLDLVCLELDEIIAEKDEYVQLQSNDTDIEQYQHQLRNSAEQAENIANAISLIGLEGLSFVCRYISNHINALGEGQQALDKEQFRLVTEWPILVKGYIKNIFVRSFTDHLIEFLRTDNWSESLTDDEWSDLEYKLVNPSFIEEEKEQRQQTASHDDVSIELPEDVNHELLEGLLQDLPSQTEEFSSALQSMIEGQIEAMDSAQRIAHTLKGAANVVGIAGIANLTHHLEDILEFLSKAEKIPTAELQDALVEAADCLEAMTEALLGIDQPPDNALAVLQTILDWANRLENDGLLDSYAVPLDNYQVSTNSVAVVDSDTNIEHESIINESTAAENMLRIPSSLADELLRLAGESMISTVQVQEHIKNSMERQEALYQHNLALEELSADLEHLIDVQGITSNLNMEMNEEFDPLEMDQYHELHSVSRRLVEIAADSIQHSNVIEMELNELRNLIIAHDQLQKENQELVLRTRMVLVNTIIPRLKRGVRQACRLTGKKVELIVEDNETRMDSEVLNGLIEPLMHVLRNAIDHGIEDADERMSAGKPESGVINLNFSRKGDHIQISIKDDGRGLDNKRIQTKALSSKLISEDQVINDDEIKRLILEPGFTTREGVTQVSGRGIGLDVVNVKIRELKGTIEIESIVGQGCAFNLTLPVSSFSAHSLMIRAQQHIYAVSSRGVDEILYPGAGSFFEHNDDVYFKIGTQSYKTAMLDELLNLNEERRATDRENRPVLLVRDELGNKVAVLVQEVIDSYNVVVKPMGKYLPQVNGIVGATILGDGSVASVVDLPELLHIASRHKKSRSAVNETPVIHEVAAKLPYILVVDDSLSARRSLAQFVEDMGFEVRTARDGMEATSLIDVYKPDLMLVDMEMPKMNGLELTSHIRASAELKHIPVIMITSRSTDKHKNAAYDKGVNHFMVKPFAEEELADLINTELGAIAV